MVDLRIVVSDPKTGKSVQREVKEEGVRQFFGLKLGDKVKGDLLGLEGYEFTLTGGSDDAGFPMRRDVQGVARKAILTTGGVGIRKNLGRGQKIRKTVAGNTVGVQTAQLNLKIEKMGKEDLFPKPAEEKKEETKVEEKPAEAQKKEKKEEVKKEEKKETPKKEEPKTEEKQ